MENSVWSIAHLLSHCRFQFNKDSFTPIQCKKIINVYVTAMEATGAKMKHPTYLITVPLLNLTVSKDKKWLIRIQDFLWGGGNTLFKSTEKLWHCKKNKTVLSQLQENREESENQKEAIM